MHEEMILYHYWRSSCSWRVRWALNVKKIPHQLVAINLLKNEQKTPAFLAKNPAGFLPTLEWQGAYFGESLAILEFLEEKFPQIPLLPIDLKSRMQVRQLTLSIIAGTQPFQNLSALDFLASDAEERKHISVHFINKGLEKYEAFLEHVNSSTYSFGSQLTFADLALIPQCYNALRNDIDLAKYPRIQGIYQRCRATEACEKASPESHEPMN